MSATSRARRSDSLYHETDSGITRRWLCDKVALLEDELHESQEELYGLHCMIAKSEAENAKLKQELETVGTAAYLYGRYDLKAENAKLRELIRKLIGLDSLYEVPMCNVNEWSRRMDSIHDEMRELGVEADG